MKVRYIKCMECGKRTMNYELGDVFYRLDDKSSTERENDVLVKDPVVCPKCKKNISDGKFEINSTDFHLAMITASICRIGQLKGHKFATPAHLRGGYSLNPADFEKMKHICRSKPKLV
ncbi:MAG: hypothetical protein O8C61_11680 [Candidatus Methanoperedens sp.]|nr:hypothetical protein [Candidatus Methanoperedens sp.]